MIAGFFAADFSLSQQKHALTVNNIKPGKIVIDRSPKYMLLLDQTVNYLLVYSYMTVYRLQQWHIAKGLFLKEYFHSVIAYYLCTCVTICGGC